MSILSFVSKAGVGVKFVPKSAGLVHPIFALLTVLNKSDFF